MSINGHINTHFLALWACLGIPILLVTIAGLVAAQRRRRLAGSPGNGSPFGKGIKVAAAELASGLMARPFELAALASVLLPIGFIPCCVIYALGRATSQTSVQMATHEVYVVASVFACSFLLALVSLTGWRRHRGNSTRVIAVCGVLFSGLIAAVAGFIAVFMDAMLNARNC